MQHTKMVTNTQLTCATDVMAGHANRLNVTCKQYVILLLLQSLTFRREREGEGEGGGGKGRGGRGGRGRGRRRGGGRERESYMETFM